MAVFCEDIREEATGTHTLVGVMPDNINLSGAPAQTEAIFFPKMGIYLRINLDTSSKPRSAVSARVTIPGADDVSLGEVGSELIEKAYAESAAHGTPAAGLLFKSVISPLQFRKPGLMAVYATIDDKEIVCGSLNILIPS